MSTVVIGLDGGSERVAAITKESADTLDGTEGDSVTAGIKATDVMVAKD